MDNKPFKSCRGTSDNYWKYQNQKSRSTHISPFPMFSSPYEKNQKKLISSELKKNFKCML